MEQEITRSGTLLCSSLFTSDAALTEYANQSTVSKQSVNFDKIQVVASHEG